MGYTPLLKEKGLKDWKHKLNPIAARDIIRYNKTIMKKKGKVKNICAKLE